MTSAAMVQDPPRRSTRIRAQLPIRVTSQEPRVAISERCHTLIVNPEGCGVRLSRPLEIGLPVLIDELPAGNSALARVASCVPLGSDGKYWVVGLALEEPANIWCIQPAPPDWEDVASAIATVPPPRKSNEWPYSFFSRKGEAHPGRK